MLSIVICDDSPAAAEGLGRMVEESVPPRVSCRIDTFSSGEALMQAVEGGLKPDIAMLDIVIGRESGIQIAKRLFPEGSPTQVIFVTGYRDYCTAVYETEHIYFLVKPVDPQELQRALQKAIDRKESSDLILRSRAVIQRIPMATIRYIESRARKVIIFCGDTVCEHYTTLTDLLPQLPENFIHCHKSYCVNMDYVVRMEADRFILSGDQPISISQAKKALTRKKFLEYLNDRL